MSQEEIMNEILAKLPAEIVEKIKSGTISEEEMNEYVLPLAEPYKEQLEGFAPLSEEQLEAVSGGSFWEWFCNWFSTSSDEEKEIPAGTPREPREPPTWKVR